MLDFYCLGWGSLIWDPRELPLASDWAHDGPSLPVEFARQSRDGRMTLVISENTKAIPVFSAKLRVTSLTEARERLAAREGVSQRFIKQSIGCWSYHEASDHAHTTAIRQWAEERKAVGVVWTALKPRFNGTVRMPSHREVIRHLQSLKGFERQRAKEYVCRTPDEIRTAYRERIEETLGWRPE